MARVLGVREIELAAGVETEDFERLAIHEYLPSTTTLGMTAHLLRGNRGERDRHYLLVEEFDSVEHRNSLFPGSETPSLEVARWIESHPALIHAWNAMLSSSRNTDYVRVATIPTPSGSVTPRSAMPPPARSSAPPATAP